MTTLKLVVVWLWIAIPLGWGVKKSLEKARPLFFPVAPAAAPAATK